jgi:hypothetical protein
MEAFKVDFRSDSLALYCVAIGKGQAELPPNLTLGLQRGTALRSTSAVPPNHFKDRAVGR